MRQLKQGAAICLASFLLSVTTYAQSDDSAVIHRELAPVEVQAIRAGADAPFAKTELTAEEIEKTNLGWDLPYLLQSTPSAVVSSDAGTGIGYTGIRIRGSDITRINVTLNGIPVNDAESQGTFFVDLPDLATSVHSIQVQRGAGSSTNGAGAFGATISISNLQQMREAGAEAAMSLGSFNTWKYSLKAGTGLLENGWQFDVRLSKISSDGYIDRSASDLGSLQLLAGWQINGKNRLRFMLLSGREKTGQAWNGVPADSLSNNRTFNELGIRSDGSYYDDQTDNYRQQYYQLFFDHEFSSSLRGQVAAFLTRGKGYYEEYKIGQSFADYGLHDFDSSRTSTDLIRQLWLDNYFYGSVFSLLYSRNKTQLDAGGGWTRYDGNHYGFVKWAQYGVPNDYRWYLLDVQKTDLNVYLKAKHRIDKLILFGEFQWRRVAYEIDGFRNNPSLHPSVSYNFFNPRIGATYFIKDNGRTEEKLYASLAITHKEPNRDDFEAAAKELPRPESLYDLEAGYELSRRHWHLGACLYYMRYKDQLVLTGKINDVGAYTRTNVPESHRTGLELTGDFSPAYWLKLNTNVACSDNRIDGMEEYIDRYDANYDYLGQDTIPHGNTNISFSPGIVINQGISIAPFRHLSRGQQLEFELKGKYVGKQYLDNTSNEQAIITPYGVCDFLLHYSVTLKPFREVGVNLLLNNIFNHLYESNGYTFSYSVAGEKILTNYYYPQAGFNMLFGLSLKW